MDKKNIETADVEKVSGGISEAANGTFWLNSDEARALETAGYRLSVFGDLPGWEGVEVGTVDYDDDDVEIMTYQINDPENRRVRDITELINVVNQHTNAQRRRPR